MLGASSVYASVTRVAQVALSDLKSFSRLICFYFVQVSFFCNFSMNLSRVYRFKS
jgi:hypothetical protein